MADAASSIPLSQIEEHGGSKIKRFEFHMSYSCDQACPFCSESVRMAAHVRHPISYRNIVKTLIRKRMEGCDHVTFTGGEPTLHPKFVEALQAAKRLGFRTYATSDGQRLADPDFAARALPLLDELCLSIHGSRPEIHDPLVKKEGSFANLMKAFDHIRTLSRPPYLLTNTVATRRNISDLKETIKLLAGLGPVKHCTISNLAPDGEALENYAELAVRLGDLARLVPALSEAANQSGIVLRLFGVPLCALGGNWALSNDLYWEPRVTVERGWVQGRAGLQEIHSPNPGRMRHFPPKCEGCGLKGKCWGVFRVYYKHFGDEELIPSR